jgi:hypothetical protein
MSFFFLSVLLLVWAEPTVVTTYQDPGEEGDVFLERPAMAAYDDQDRLWVLDPDAGLLFRWHKDGRFDRTLGAKGEGPGEFLFRGRGPGAAGLAIAADQVYVMDGKRTVQVFDLEGKYLSAINPDFRTSRISGFHVLKEGSLLFQQSSFMSETPTAKLSLHDAQAKPIRELASFPETGFRREGPAGQRPTAVTLIGYAGQLASTYDAQHHLVIFGHGEKPALTIFDPVKGTSQTVELPLAQRKVEQEDKDEFQKIPMFQNAPFPVKAEFPEKKALFNRLLWCEEGILVLDESPVYHEIRGILVDKAGVKRQDIHLRCGEGGTLMAASGRSVWSHTSEEGDLVLQRLRFAPAAVN